MTQEDKELSLKDLCARLPYGVIGQCEIDASYDTPFDTKSQTHKFNAVVYGLTEDLLVVSPMIENQDELEFANEEIADGVDILDFKPYLFPLSSMTEIQCYELASIRSEFQDCWKYVKTPIPLSICNFEQIDWFNKNHFDYRGLIEKRLAIDATGLNILAKKE